MIVTHNSEAFIKRCTEALAAMSPGTRTVVVDNASSDGTLTAIDNQPGLQIIANRVNRGFAAAVNQGVQAAEAEFILLVNPDVKILTPVDKLIEAARLYGLAAGRLVNEYGTDQKGFALRSFPRPADLIFELAGLNRLWPSNPVNRRYRCLDRDMNQPGPVEQPPGALLMFRRDVWTRLGGLDERFFPIWFEDVDFCVRSIAAGYRIEYVPCVVAEHHGGHSAGALPPGCRAVLWCDSLLEYAAKHFRSLDYRAICLAVVLTSVPRMVAGMIRQRTLSPVVGYSKVVRSASRRFILGRGSRQGHRNS